VRPVARHAGVRLLVEGGDGLDVRARPGEIAQVLLNVVRNALDGFVRRGTGAGEHLVRLVVRVDGHRVIVETIDNAGGVSPGQVPRLFRLGLSTRGSTGVGLYLARCLAERNGGTLDYRRADGGSCFTLALPRAGAVRRARGAAGPGPAEPVA
jgi:signal transduction histidine kinase